MRIPRPCVHGTLREFWRVSRDQLTRIRRVVPPQGRSIHGVESGGEKKIEVRRYLLCQQPTEKCQRNTHLELHDIDPKVFFYHGTDPDAGGPAQELGIRRVNNELGCGL